MGKNLDEELARAAGLGEDTERSEEEHSETSQTEGMAVPQPAEPPQRRSNRGLLIMLLVMVASIIALFLFAFKPSATYTMPVEQLVNGGQEHVGKRVRIDGELVPNTLTKRDKPCEFRFLMRGQAAAKDKNVEVRFPQCIVPDTFRDVPEGGVMVTAEGSLTKEGYFEATSIMAKCSSKYDPKTHTMDGQPKNAKKVSPESID
ncbi:MAG TPA: cytochrome c maturation protein CcmE [Polyangiaceae bacterium]|nr:cytochrome c maturation protein CcmE [Polyangiaceae bacterium]